MTLPQPSNDKDNQSEGIPEAANSEDWARSGSAIVATWLVCLIVLASMLYLVTP